MTKRLASTLGLWSLVILTLIWLGIEAGVWLLALLALLSQEELYQLMGKIGFHSLRKLGLFCGFLIIVGSYYLPEYSFFALSVAICSCGAFTRVKGGRALNSLMATLFGILFVPYLLQFLIQATRLCESEMSGTFLAIWIVATLKFTDVGALLVGMKFGRTKLAPKVSPAKTWEGAIGGVTLAVIVSALYAVVFGFALPESFLWWKAGLAAIPLGIMAVVSDLIESIIKRQARVKDSGKFIPGIGGAFDLVDSILLGAPVGYMLLLIILI